MPADFYQHRYGLMAAQQTRYKLSQLARDLIASDGQLGTVPGVRSTTRMLDLRWSTATPPRNY